jgi:hypothetical protein
LVAHGLAHHPSLASDVPTGRLNELLLHKEASAQAMEA